MLVVDASCLFEVVADTPSAGYIAARLALDIDHAAPQVVDAEVMGVIRSQLLRGGLDRTSAGQAIGDLRDWPGERGWDAFHVALAEVFDATLLAMDARLGRAHGPLCRIEVMAA